MKLLLLLTEAFDINDPKQVADRIEVYRRISKESNGPGERATAENLLNKLIIAAKAAGTYREPKAKPTYDKPKSDSYYWGYANSKYGHNAKKEEPKKEPPKQDSNPAAFKVVFLGHYEDFSNNSNKVWGWGTKNGKIWQFWGRYNGTPQIKSAGKATDLGLDFIAKLAKTKAAKGYEKVSVEGYKEWMLKVLDSIREHELRD